MSPFSSKKLSDFNLIHLSIKQFPGPISLAVKSPFLNIIVSLAIPPIFKKDFLNFPIFYLLLCEI